MTDRTQKKYLELEDVRVYYNRKEDSIQILTADERVLGSPFKITLSRGTQTDATLRKVMVAEGFITEEQQTQVQHISSDRHRISIGFLPSGDPAVLEMTKVRNLVVTGAPGAGKTNLVDLLLRHTAAHAPNWRTFAVPESEFSTNDEAADERLMRKQLFLAHEYLESSLKRNPSPWKDALVVVDASRLTPVRKQEIDNLASRIADDEGRYGMHVVYVAHQQADVPDFILERSERVAFRSMPQSSSMFERQASSLETGEAYFDVKGQPELWGKVKIHASDK